MKGEETSGMKSNAKERGKRVEIGRTIDESDREREDCNSKLLQMSFGIFLQSRLANGCQEPIETEAFLSPLSTRISTSEK
jgi:hypothetical protein